MGRDFGAIWATSAGGVDSSVGAQRSCTGRFSEGAFPRNDSWRLVLVFSPLPAEGA